MEFIPLRPCPPERGHLSWFSGLLVDWSCGPFTLQDQQNPAYSRSRDFVHFWKPKRYSTRWQK